jgi:hypothetical protein
MADSNASTPAAPSEAAPMIDFDGYTIVPGAIEALGPVRPKHEGGHRVFSFAIYLRGGQSLSASFATDAEANQARSDVVAKMASPE